MIRNQTDYRKAMCKMIRKIQNSSSAEEINDLEMSIVKMLLIRVTKGKPLVTLIFYEKTEVKGP